MIDRRTLLLAGASAAFATGASSALAASPPAARPGAPGRCDPEATTIDVVRVLATPDGESDFDTLCLTFGDERGVEGSPAVRRTVPIVVERYSVYRFPAGWTADWHPAVDRLLFYTFAGAYELTTTRGGPRRFDVGSFVLMDDLSGRGHRSRVIEAVSAIVCAIPRDLPIR